MWLLHQKEQFKLYLWTWSLKTKYHPGLSLGSNINSFVSMRSWRSRIHGWCCLDDRWCQRDGRQGSLSWRWGRHNVWYLNKNTQKISLASLTPHKKNCGKTIQLLQWRPEGQQKCAELFPETLGHALLEGDQQGAEEEVWAEEVPLEDHASFATSEHLTTGW